MLNIRTSNQQVCSLKKLLAMSELCLGTAVEELIELARPLAVYLIRNGIEFEKINISYWY